MRFLQDFVLPGQTPNTHNDQVPSGAKMLIIAALYDAMVILSMPYLKGPANEERYKETWEWMFSDRCDSFSYLWICTHLNIHPQEIRDEIRFGNFTKHARRRRIGRNKYAMKME